MDTWKRWPERAKSAKLASKKSDADLSAVITEMTGRKAGRAQVNHWFTGKREPTIRQFMILCAEIGADPGEILFGVKVLPAMTGTAKLAAEALQATPLKNPHYAMQEKRMKMRRKPKQQTSHAAKEKQGA